MKGKPWNVEEENKLRDWFKSGITDLAVLSKNFEGKYSRQAVRQKIFALGLKEKHQVKKIRVVFLLSLFCLRSCRVLRKHLRTLPQR